MTQFGYGSNGMNELQGISAGGATHFQGTTARPVQPVTMNSGAVNATMLSPQSFIANPTLSSGMNTESVKATSGGGTNTTNNYYIGATGPSSSSLTYDADGELTSDGTNTYAWDAENRLFKITYPGTGNSTQFTYDCFGRCVKIVESGTSPSFLNPATMNFVWCGNDRCEARDGSGNVLAQYFGLGETQSGTSLFYTRDHLGSVRELTNSTGTVEMAQAFDPSGRVTQLYNASSDYASQGFAGYYVHQRSGLSLTTFREYSPQLGRWLSRDPLGGANPYNYVENNSISFVDPLGLCDPFQGGNIFTPGFNNLRSNLTGFAHYLVTNPYNGQHHALPWLQKPHSHLENVAGAAAITPWGAAFKGAGGPLAFAEGAGGGAATEETVALYRAVQPGEFSSIQDTGGFSNPYGIEVKYFSTTAEGASQYAQMSFGRTGITEPYTIVSTEAPASLVESVPYVDRGVPAVVIRSENLGGLTPQVWNYSPLP